MVAYVEDDGTEIIQHESKSPEERQKRKMDLMEKKIPMMKMSAIGGKIVEAAKEASKSFNSEHEAVQNFQLAPGVNLKRLIQETPSAAPNLGRATDTKITSGGVAPKMGPLEKINGSNLEMLPPSRQTLKLQKTATAILKDSKNPIFKLGAIEYRVVNRGHGSHKVEKIAKGAESFSISTPRPVEGPAKQPGGQRAEALAAALAAPAQAPPLIARENTESTENTEKQDTEKKKLEEKREREAGEAARVAQEAEAAKDSEKARSDISKFYKLAIEAS